MKHLTTILFLFAFTILLRGQENIGGIVNEYFAVSAIPNTNTITCTGEDLSSLEPGDKVLLIQMTGAGFTIFNVRDNNHVDQNIGSGGKYEFLSVLTVNNVSKEITFTANFKNSYTAGEKIQLVKAFVGYDVNVASELTAPDWDGNKGGILALVILQKLNLSADINLSGKGFRGANPASYLKGCRPFNTNDTMYFPTGSVNKGGIKGEGIKPVASNYTIGPGNNFNGGGGGIGKFGGGGGGSNYSRGGAGGFQQIYCPTAATEFGSGGNGLEDGSLGATVLFGGFYSNYKKITFGGGGGGSTDSTGLSASKGGDGGGLVIILADTIVANGNSIIANGESVVTPSTAGAAGGGAGGTVLLDVTYYSGLLSVDAMGGEGGSTLGGNCGGAGGGGAGGTLLIAASATINQITYDLSGGLEGGSQCGSNLGSPGIVGDTLRNYITLLNGFTFNAISTNDTICNDGDIPHLLIGTVPKGTTNYQYKWLQSTNNINWVPVSPAVTTKNYQPPALSDTTYYTREVYFPDDNIRDTALSVMILVYPNLSGNTLTLRDTICSGVAPGVLSANPVTGGSGVNIYRWESSTNQITWTPRGNSILLNEVNKLVQPTYYRRHVESGPGAVCYSLSNVDTLSVIDSLSNNLFLNPFLDTIICNGLSSGTILGSQPTGGDGSYRYGWIQSSNGIAYSPVGAATSINYSPGSIPATRHYKRIVYSGSDDACIDTTIARLIEVLPVITNNVIDSDSLRYCSGDSPLALKQKASFTLGGGDGTYSYQWQQFNGSSWINLSGQTASSYLPGILTDTTEYRRIVYSGLVTGSVYACVNQSAALSVDVIPAIVNNLVSDDENICQESQPQVFSETGATGGAGSSSFIYLWQQNINGTGWSNASGINTSISYTPPVLFASTQYRRLATSQICSKISDTVNILVYPSIETNLIQGAPVQYVCYNSTKLFNGAQPTGGNGSYDYFWQNSTDASSWSNIGSNTVNYTSEPLTAQHYFRRIVFSGDLDQCKDTSDFVLAKINQLPTGDIVSSVDTLCAGEELSIAYENLNGNGSVILRLGETSILYASSPLTNSSGNITFSLSESANIRILELQDDSTCFADTSLTTGRVLATVYEVPVANPGADIEACGLTVQMNAVLSTSLGTGLWTSDDAVFDNPANPASQASVNGFGQSILTWTETNWECIDLASIVVTAYEQPIAADAGEDQILPYTFTTQLEANEPQLPATGAWRFVSGNGTFGDSTLANTTVEFPGIGEFQLSWTITNGVCSPVSDNLKVLINDLTLNNGFSPNDDGVNDSFVISIPSGQYFKVSIYDRNGQIVKNLDGTLELTWDGTGKNGQQVPEDTYYYVLEEEGKSARAGYIEIRR